MLQLQITSGHVFVGTNGGGIYAALAEFIVFIDNLQRESFDKFALQVFGHLMGVIWSNQSHFFSEDKVEVGNFSGTKLANFISDEAFLDGGHPGMLTIYFIESRVIISFLLTGATEFHRHGASTSPCRYIGFIEISV
ncbi:hypothetical protein D3C87_1305410 [compost metagenome]